MFTIFHFLFFFHSESYVAIPLNVEHFVTNTGEMITRIRFIISSGSSIVLGANIEPLASVNDILRTIDFRIYQQCAPYIPLSILLPLNLCIPVNEISLWTTLITNAVATATGKTQRATSHFTTRSIIYFQVKRILQ